MLFLLMLVEGQMEKDWPREILMGLLMQMAIHLPMEIWMAK